MTAQSSDKARITYAPMTSDEIELVRAVLNDGTYTKQEQKDIGLLCDMAASCLLYAEEINRLRSAPRPSSAETGESLDPVEFVINANDIGATVVPVIHYRALKRELAEAKRDLASSRFIRARSCCCETDEQGDEIVRWCGLHAELRDELAEAKVLLANQAQAVVAMNSARSSSAEPKPVAWRYTSRTTGDVVYKNKEQTDGSYRYGPYDCQPLYASPISARSETDTVTEGTVQEDAARFRFLCRHVRGEVRHVGTQYKRWWWSTENTDHNFMRALDAAMDGSANRG